MKKKTIKRVIRNPKGFAEKLFRMDAAELAWFIDDLMRYQEKLVDESPQEEEHELPVPLMDEDQLKAS